MSLRNLFPGYYRPSESDFAKMWEDGIFVFDTNVLLNLYRYTSSTRNELFRILEQLQNSIWIPHQVGLEFSRRREQVIREQDAIFDDIEKIVGKTSIDNLHTKYKRGHSFAAIEKITAILQQAKFDILQEIERAKKEAPDLSYDDPYLKQIEQLFEDKIGPPYTQTRLEELQQREFAERYRKRIPPGFKDASKGKQEKEQDKIQTNDNNMYGDVILWYQILDHAKELKRPILLITDDQKEDWWWREGNKTLGPRPELVEEMYEKAQVVFYMYPVDRFMERASQFFKIGVQSEAIQEAHESRTQGIGGFGIGVIAIVALLSLLIFSQKDVSSLSEEEKANRNEVLQYIQKYQKDASRIEETTGQITEEAQFSIEEVFQQIQDEQDTSALEEE